MRIKKIVNYELWSGYNTKFLGLANKEIYGIS